MSFFATNPFATQVGQLIERASDPAIPDDNVELFYEICDVINVKEENAKDALKAIRKKLSIYAGRNWSVVMKLLNLLDLCVSNCNKRFHLQIANKDFLQELKNMIGPKLQPPIVVQEKVLSLIQKWANQFKNDTELKAVEIYYNDLRSKGIDFPVAEETKGLLDIASVRPTINESSSSTTSAHLNTNTRPTHTMLRSTQSLPPAANNSAVASATANALPTMTQINAAAAASANASNVREVQVATAITLSAEQIGKLNSELDIVECNVQVFNDVINELTQTQVQNKHLNEYNAEIEILRELSRTCKDMQNRITQLIGSITNESMINELLRVNDDLNNVFLRHERFERGLPPNQNTLLTNSASPNNKNTSPNASAYNVNNNNNRVSINSNNTNNNNAAYARKVEDKPLIDFDSDVNTNKLSKIHLTSTNHSDLGNSEATAFLQDENEIKEIENWLKTQGETEEDLLKRDNKNKSNEFDEFLNQRMNAQTGNSRSPQRDPFASGGAAAAASTNTSNSNNRHIKTDTKSKFEL